jgi:MoxR-like ATPase
MAEHQVTIGENSYRLPEPFFVLATQNPIEQEGTYNLPEAELDRFLLKIIADYPTPEEEMSIVKSEGRAAEISVQKIFSAEILAKCRDAVDAVTVDDKMVAYIVSIVNFTRAQIQRGANKNSIQRYISFGASPRAGISLLRCAKVHALFENRSFVLSEDIQAVAKPVLRHRLVLNYEAAAENVSADDLISKIIELIPLP